MDLRKLVDAPESAVITIVPDNKTVVRLGVLVGSIWHQKEYPLKHHVNSLGDGFWLAYVAESNTVYYRRETDLENRTRNQVPHLWQSVTAAGNP